MHPLDWRHVKFTRNYDITGGTVSHNVFAESADNRYRTHTASIF